MSGAASLDHVGIVGGDLDGLADVFGRLGFCLTPLARHAGGRTGNRCVMLRQGYLELIATVDGGSSATIDRFLARHSGAHIIALGIEDEGAALDRLHRAGIGQAQVSHTDRAVDDADPDGMRARFALVTSPDLDAGRINLIHHLTPEAVWQERFLSHPNHAVALAEVIIVAAVPAVTAAGLSRVAGRPLAPDPRGGYALDLPQGRLRIVPPEGTAALLPGTCASPEPRVAGIVLRTDDGNHSLLARLGQQGLLHRITDDSVLVDARGCTLRFEGAAPVC